MSTLVRRILKSKNRFFYPLVILVSVILLAITVMIIHKNVDSSINYEIEIGNEESSIRNLFWDYFHKDDINEFRRISKLHPLAIPQDLIKEYYAKIGPNKMLSVIEENPQCHVQGHNIGKEIYYRTKNLGQSTNLCQTKCSTGCFHGILMGMTSSNETDDTTHPTYEQVINQMQNVCDSSEVKGKISKGACIHGVGHVLTVMHNYNTQSAVNSCNIFNDPGLVYYCATGVYMEREFIYHKTDNSISQTFPCDHSPFPAACYRYKLLVYFKADDYPQSKSLCSSLSTPQQRRGCFHGLGYRSHAVITKDPSKLETICSDDDKVAEKMCVEGAIGYIKEMDKKAATNICNIVNSNLKDSCTNAILVGNFGLTRDFNPYIN